MPGMRDDRKLLMREGYSRTDIGISNSCREPEAGPVPAPQPRQGSRAVGVSAGTRGVCAACGSPWPCATARRVGAPEGTRVPSPLSPMIGGAGGCERERRRSRHPATDQSASRAGRPTALGYVRLAPGGAAVPVTAGMAGLEAFARKQGWTLGEVFVDDQFGRPMVAWASLTVAARNLHVAAVLVPDVPGLRPETETALEYLRSRCARQIGALLMLAPPVTDNTPVLLTPDESVDVVARQIAPVVLLPPVRRARRGPRPSAGIRRN